MKALMNIDQVKYADVEENGLYTSSRGRTSDHNGAKKLGYSLRRCRRERPGADIDASLSHDFR
jgi:hypothetical protein